jgi:hypothetical protein
LHWYAHCAPLQVATPFVTFGQAVHAALPQPFCGPGATQPPLQSFS